MEIELGSIFVVLLVAFGSLIAFKWMLKNVNGWFYESKLGEKKYLLPPGDLGLPFIGNMWSFLRAFKSSDPDTFISSFVSRSHLSLSLSPFSLSVSLGFSYLLC